jgi:uncharacterized protein YbjT (DUF2867 family)
MYIILGGTGHVGSSVATTLLEKGKEVTVITHNPQKAPEWEQKGAKVTIVDVYDSDKLHAVFKNGERLFLLNPEADPATDTVIEEQRTLSSILKALENSGIKKVVAQSTEGAQPGEGIGDLGVLYDMEERLKKMNLPADIIRAGYYMSNWDGSLETAEKEGRVYTFYPVDFKLPMVAPKDIGMIAAGFLTNDARDFRIHYVEGPEMYSSADVAKAFSKALNKPVEAMQIPEEKWLPTLKRFGFSDKAARSMAAMTEITLNNLEKAESPIRGNTILNEYIENLVSRKMKDDSTNINNSSEQRE